MGTAPHSFLFLFLFLFVTGPGRPAGASPTRTGRQCQGPQVKPPGPQLEGLDAPLPEPALDPVSTLTDVKLLSTSWDPHWGQSGLSPFEYSDMDMRISKGKLQYWHL